MVTYAEPVYPRVLDELIPSARHHARRWADNRTEGDHSRLKRRLRARRGPRTDRSAIVIMTGSPSSRTSVAATTTSPSTFRGRSGAKLAPRDQAVPDRNRPTTPAAGELDPPAFTERDSAMMREARGSSVEEADMGGSGVFGGLSDRGLGLLIERGLHEVPAVLAV